MERCWPVPGSCACLFSELERLITNYPPTLMAAWARAAIYKQDLPLDSGRRDGIRDSWMERALPPTAVSEGTRPQWLQLPV